MKSPKKKLLLAITAVSLAVSSFAADVAVSDSIVALVTNGTKNYTFTDPASGQSATVALTIAPFSTDPLATFVALDGDTRAAVGNTNVGGDGNLITYGEGVTFSASIASATFGVVPGSVQFSIAGLGLRAPDGTATVAWASTATASNSFIVGPEAVVALDTGLFPLNGTNYSARLDLTLNDGSNLQLSDAGGIAGLGLVLNASFTVTNGSDPRTNSWFTANAGKYARIYTTDANKSNGVSVTTWSNGTQTQASPAYSGVQEVYSSASWLYVRSSGLGSHIMGPWYLNAAHTTAFPNYPVNQKALYRIPRVPTVAGAKTLTGLGAIGYFVDGIAMFDSRDGFVWTGTTESGTGTGYWNHEAYVNEGVTFDPGYAHQEGTGNHHYHANPVALRYLLGDHVDYNPATKTYSESTNAATKHSPILGWVRDGYPVYGPYGYSSASNAASGVRRMISGFVLRNGQNGTQNLTATGRTAIPKWAGDLYGVSTNQTCTNVSAAYPLGRYMEDNDYLGDLGYTNGVHFDLDQYNGRWCYTPEFPNGTYAYFVSISSNGTPTFPYNIGRAFYGSPTGSAQTSITEAVTTNFNGGPNAPLVLNPPANNNGTVTLTWSAIEGGTYRVESSANLTAWTTNSTNVSALLNAASYTNNSPDNARFYRAARTALATYDAVNGTGSGGGGGSVAPGGSATRGTTVTVTITLPNTPPQPPANVIPTSVTLAGTIVGTTVSRPTAGTVLATFAIPAGAATGLQNIVVTFTPAPTYNMLGAFTINP